MTPNYFKSSYRLFSRFIIFKNSFFKIVNKSVLLVQCNFLRNSFLIVQLNLKWEFSCQKWLNDFVAESFKEEKETENRENYYTKVKFLAWVLASSHTGLWIVSWEFSWLVRKLILYPQIGGLGSLPILQILGASSWRVSLNHKVLLESIIFVNIPHGILICKH